MKERKREFDETKITGFFDKDTKINGDLDFQGTFRIDGHFKGNINSESMLIVGDNGKIEAEIKVGYIVIGGEVKGNVRATDKVEIHSNGRVLGTIITPKLVIEEGAYLEANCQTTDRASPPQPEKPLTEKDGKTSGSQL
jgi:cytoskeletal protein CcmA (bactofilin family)